MIQHINTAVRRIPQGALYIVLPVFGIVAFYQGLTGGLGPEPINALEREFGELALKLLIVGLAITPLLRFVGINLVKFRRPIGVMAFVYALAHLLVWAILDVQLVSQMWADILKRPYIAVGMMAFVLMIPLAFTSNNWSVRRMGPLSWRRLHKLTYGVAILAGLHFIMLSKGFQLEPMIYGMVIVGFLATRLRSRS